MASVIETTAVALRKGNTEANKAFCGICAELVADLGEDGTGTDLNTTLRLHNGVITGGIPMCRADLLNISTSQLAENRDSIGLTGEKNLAYANLSNLEVLDDAAAKNHIVNTFNNYGLAKTSDVEAELATKANVNMSNINTVNLATSGAGHAGKDLAYADLTNADTTAVTDGTNTIGPVLATADTTNINTADLVDSTKHDGTDGNKPLAYADLTNVSGQAFNTALFTTHDNVLHIEQTTNKIESYYDEDGKPIELDTNQYPNVTAVQEYVGEAIKNGSFMKTDIRNATSYDVLYSNAQQDISASDIITTPNNSVPYKYILDTERDIDHDPSQHGGNDLSGIMKQGTAFVAGKIYCTYNDVSMTNCYAHNFVQKESLKISIDAINSNGIPTAISVWQNHGVNDLGTTTQSINDNDGKEVTFTLTATAEANHSGYYTYTVSNINTGTATSMTFQAGTVVDLTTPLLIDQVLWIKADIVGTNGELLKCSFYPEFSGHYVEPDEFPYTYEDPETHEQITVYNTLVINNGGQDGVVDFKCWNYLPDIGGAGLVKTDLSNLLGMSQIEADKAKGTPWKLIQDDPIPSISASTISDINYYSLTNKGNVWDALKDAYEKTMGQAAGVEQGGALTDVATYVKRTLDNYALSDTYRGQVLYYLADESTIGNYTTRPNSSTPIQTGDQILLKQKSDILGGRPYLATATNTSGTITWTYEPFVNQSSAQSNGDYVYCLDLGTWDTEDYHNVPGNITWNANVTPGRLDIAPDSYNAPDEITIVKDSSTGKLKLGNFYVPGPEYFTGANTNSQTITLQNNATGKIPFDVYVSGVFQYPNSYTYNQNTKQITLSFAIPAVSNNIAVVYRGVVFSAGGSYVGTDGVV